VLLLDEGSVAITDKGGGVPVGQEHLRGAVDSRSSAGTQKFQGAGRSESPAKSTFRPRPRVAADTIVQSLSGDADALLDCYTKKSCK
jgi:hypothetical protein